MEQTPSSIRVNCKAPQSGDQHRVLKEPPIFATSNNYVSDIEIVILFCSWITKFRDFFFIFIIFLALDLFKECISGKGAKGCM